MGNLDNSDNAAISFCICFVLVIGVVVGLILNSNDDLIEECQKQNNVYRCELIAVPVEKVESEK